jgi:Uma2 family endonuclease
LPGAATERDLLRRIERDDQLCELVDGVLVEKPVGWHESQLAIWLAHYFCQYLEQHPIGAITGGDGPYRLRIGLVRLPDVAFVSYQRLPAEAESAAIAPIGPDLAVEILSPSNRKAEIERKLDEYFAAGTRLAWIVNPIRRTVRVYTSRTDQKLLTERNLLTGGGVLPGLRISIRTWFAKAERGRR